MTLIGAPRLRLSANGRPRVPARPATRRGQLALLAVNLAAVTVFLLSYSRHGIGLHPYRIDLNVYRLGSQMWRSGGNLYGQLPRTAAGIRLPFTYPPFAAIALAPLSMLPMAAAALLTVVSVASAAVALRVVLRGLAGRGGGTWWTVAWLLPPALALEPLRATLSFGQVNLLLLALVAADCLARDPRWPRGALTGLAAAVKLTPATFVLYFLLRRDYRAAGTAGLSFAVATAAGFALAGRDSVRYWAGTVLHAGRIGNPAYAGNQSVLAVLARAGIAPYSPGGTAVWLALCAAVTGLACRGMRRALAAAQDCWALSLNALAALLISPVSWSHHWVWCLPVLLTLTALGRRGRARLPAALAAGGLVMFAASPQWWFPAAHGRELRWALWEQALGSSYVLFAVLVLALAATGAISGLRSGHAGVCVTWRERTSPTPLTGRLAAGGDRLGDEADGGVGAVTTGIATAQPGDPP